MVVEEFSIHSCKTELFLLPINQTVPCRVSSLKFDCVWNIHAALDTYCTSKNSFIVLSPGSVWQLLKCFGQGPESCESFHLEVQKLPLLEEPKMKGPENTNFITGSITLRLVSSKIRSYWVTWK